MEHHHAIDESMNQLFRLGHIQGHKTVAAVVCQARRDAQKTAEELTARWGSWHGWGVHGVNGVDEQLLM